MTTGDSNEIYAACVRGLFDSKQFAIFEIAGSALLFALGMLTVIISLSKADQVGPGLGLIVMMPLPFAQGVRQLRRHRRQRPVGVTSSQ